MLDKAFIKHAIRAHETIVANILDLYIENQKPFQIILSNINSKYEALKLYCEDGQDFLLLEVSNWNLEEAELIDHNKLFCPFVFAEDVIIYTNIDFIDIEIVTCLTMKNPIYMKLGWIGIQNRLKASEPQMSVDEIQHIDTSKFEDSNKDDIKHSMSKLTLCKPGE